MPSNGLTDPYDVRGMSRGVDLRLLCFVLLIYTLSLGILSVIIPLYSYGLGADRLTVGVILSANAVAHIPASLLWGKASDRIGRKSVLGIGMLLSSVTVPLFAFVNKPLLLVFIALLRGLVGAPFWVVPMALIADLYESHEIGQVYGKVGMIQGIGFITGPIVGGFLIDRLNYPHIFYVCSAVSLSAALLVFSRFQGKSEGYTREVQTSSRIQPELGARPKKSSVIAYIDIIFSAIFLGVIGSQFIVHASEVTGEEYLVGFLSASYFVTETFIQPLGGRLADTIGRQRTILGAFVLCVIGFLILTVHPSFVSFLIAVLIVGGGVGILYIAPPALLMDEAPPAQRGLIAGFQNIAWGIGFFLGPLLGGAVAIYSDTAPYILCIITSAIGCILSLIIYTKSD